MQNQPPKNKTTNGEYKNTKETNRIKHPTHQKIQRQNDVSNNVTIRGTQNTNTQNPEPIIIQ